jgi:hypothetical protein
MDDADLDNRVQRTADWLRRGVNPNSNGTEADIAQGLDKLSQQLQQAQKGMSQEKPRPGSGIQGDQSALLGQVERLREQIQAMSGSSTNQPRSSSNQAGQRQWNTAGQPSRNGQSGAQRDGTSGSQQMPASARNRLDGSGGPASSSGNQAHNSASGDIRYGGGLGADGTAWNNINTGSNRYGQPRQPTNSALDASQNPADSERAYQQEMRQLNQLRQLAHGDPQTEKEVAELTRQMQHLDPSRFPGNPAMVEQMHREVLSSVDKLELELERAGAAPEARTGKPDAVPSGYQDAVADYYKRLSSSPQR